LNDLFPIFPQGLILGSNIGVWNDRDLYRLSQILEMYYSERGVTFETRYRACDRGMLFSNAQKDLLAQAKSFAYVYNNRTSRIKVGNAEESNNIYRLVEEAYSKMSGFASKK